MRGATVVPLALVLFACTPASPAITPSPSPTREPGALNVTALLDLSGTRQPSSGAQRDALQLWADQHASSTPRVRLKIVDVAGSVSKTALELRRAAVEDRADAIVIGATVEYDEAFASAVQLTQLPVLFTLPLADPATPTGGGWAFALAPTPAQLARLVLDDIAARSIVGATVIVSDESASAVGERAALGAELTRRGLIANVVKVTAADATQRLRSVLATTQFVIFAGAPKPYLEGSRGAPSGPTLYFSYVSEVGDIGDLRDAATQAQWPGSRWISLAATSGTSARMSFLQTYTERAGPPSSPAASAYDALTLLSSAAAGGLEPGRIRDRLQSGTFAGVATTYAFTKTRHAGFAAADLALLRFTSARAAPVVR